MSTKIAVVSPAAATPKLIDICCIVLATVPSSPRPARRPRPAWRAGAIDFRYDESWLKRDDAIPVSLSLPLREDRYIGAPVFAVFDNFLPNNQDIRRRLAERSQAEGSDA